MRYVICVTGILLMGLLAACQVQQESQSQPPVVEITARDYSFAGVPDTLKSGWTTLKLINAGMEPHFILLDFPPDSIRVDDFVGEAGAAFDTVWARLRSGRIDRQQAGQQLVELLPEWYFGTRQMGGTGMIGAGDTTQTTLKLQPGYYILECYVKDAEGRFHVSLGMVEDFVVTDDSTEAEPPRADMHITLTNSDITLEGTPASGRQTFAVHFEEHPEVGLGNDMHLARVSEEGNLDTLRTWMDWMNRNGLTPNPPADFLGGTQEMPVGNTAYFTVQLEPGSYVLLTETVESNVRTRRFTVN